MQEHHYLFKSKTKERVLMTVVWIVFIIGTLVALHFIKGA